MNETKETSAVGATEGEVNVTIDYSSSKYLKLTPRARDRLDELARRGNASHDNELSHEPIEVSSNDGAVNLGDGCVLGVLETDVEKVLAEHLEKNARLKDFFEGNWDLYNFNTFDEGFDAFYDELHRAGFEDKQKDVIFTKAGLIGWKEKARSDKVLLLKQARRRITERKKNEPTKNDKPPITLADVEALPDSNGTDVISNYIVYRKERDGHTVEFFAKVSLQDGELKKELVPPRTVPLKTAPSTDFYTCDYVSIPVLFDEMRATHERYVVYKDPIYADLSALATLASYFREAYYTYPYIDFISAEPESGKTTALKVMVFTGYYGTVASSFTEALMFREIDDAHCFYGLDNVERLFGRGEDYQAIIDWLNSSYSRDIPCKRLEKVDDRWIVRHFDGYGIKAFTHIRDFPPKHRALKTRTIPIVMQPGNPHAYYPTAEKFTDIRDKCYNARLREHERVKQSYADLIHRNILTGRLGDLYLPLLTIAKLVSDELYKRVLSFAKSEGSERVEYDEYNVAIIEVLSERCLFGTFSSQDVKKLVVDKLREKGLLRDTDRFTTQQITNRLKRLGFKRDPRRSQNRAWFTIQESQVNAKMLEYNLLTLDPPELSNFSNFSNREGYSEGDGEGSQERGLTNDLSTDKIESETIKMRRSEKSEKSEKSARYKEVIKNVCDRCGKNAATTPHKDELLCEECAFQDVQTKEAAAMMREEEVPVQ